MALSQQEQLIKDQAERRALIANAIADVPQANIDLMCLVISGDSEKRSSSYWLAEAFVYVHKYQDRLRKYAEERKQAKDRKANEDLFARYLTMNPKEASDPAKLLNLMIKFGVCPQVSLANVSADAKQETKAA